MQKLNGPFLAPRNGQAKNLVILLHGYGDSGNGLLPIGHEWASDLPDTAFVAPHAVAPCDAWASGYQWFPIRAAEAITTKAFDREELIGPPSAALDAFIDAQLAHWGVDESRLAVMGFSQGAMMAMYTMPRRKKACAAVLGYSGMLVGAKGLQGEGIVRMPVLAVHGAVDDIVPPSCLDGVQEGFSAAGFDVETIMRPGLPHSIDAFGLNRGLEFIKEAFEKADK